MTPQSECISYLKGGEQLQPPAIVFSWISHSDVYQTSSCDMSFKQPGTQHLTSFARTYN